MQISSIANEITSKYDTFLLDCDGVLWQGDTVIPGVPETLAELRAKNKRIFFITNNSTKSREQYAQKVEKLGISAHPDEILGTAYATAEYLKGKCRSAYMIGEEGLKIELENVGIKVRGIEDNGKSYNMEEMSKMIVPSDIDAVVVGLDSGFNAYKLAYAFLCLKQNPRCLFVATNLDATFPIRHGVLLPGAGSVVASVATSIGRKPLVIGKPEPIFLDIMESAGVSIDHRKTLMVGDRLDTDISFGKNRNLATLLVLTGVSTEDEANSSSNPFKPDYILPSLSDLRS